MFNGHGEHCGNVIERQLPAKRPQLSCDWCAERMKVGNNKKQIKRECDKGLTRSRKGHFGFLRCSCRQCKGKEGDWISDKCRERMNEEGEEGEEE